MKAAVRAIRKILSSLRRLLPERTVLMRAPVITCSIKIIRADGTVEDGPAVTNVRDFIQAGVK